MQNVDLFWTLRLRNPVLNCLAKNLITQRPQKWVFGISSWNFSMWYSVWRLTKNYFLAVPWEQYWTSALTLTWPWEGQKVSKCFQKHILGYNVVFFKYEPISYTCRVFEKHYCKKTMCSERVEISKSQLSTPNKRFLEKVKLFCTIIRPNLANSDAKFGQFWKIKITVTYVPKMSTRI